MRDLLFLYHNKRAIVHLRLSGEFTDYAVLWEEVMDTANIEDVGFALDEHKRLVNKARRHNRIADKHIDKMSALNARILDRRR